MSDFISFLAFAISIFTFWYSNWRNVKFSLQKENQIQLHESSVLAFNIFFLINTKGSDKKWSYLKFNSATVLFPDGKNEEFNCRAYLFESGIGQKNESRNVPIAIKGGDNVSKTVAFQNNPKLPVHSSWIEGNYQVNVFSEDAKKDIHKVTFTFKLEKRELEIIRRPNTVCMIKILN